MKTYELFINGEFIPNGDREMLDEMVEISRGDEG